MNPSSLAVSARFRKLLDRSVPSPLEVARAKSSLKSIQGRLAADYSVVKSVWIGSHAKHTAIHVLSDIDLLVVFRRSALKWGDGYISSPTFLTRVKQSVQKRYPATEVRRDAQAVVVNLGGGRHSVDVVPGVYDGPGSSGYPEYAIPDGGGGWLVTSPEVELAIFKDEDKKARGKLSGLVRLFKVWMYARATPIPLSTLHLERLLWSGELARGPAGYAELFTAALYLLNRRNGAALRDPLGVSGLLPVARTATQVGSVLDSVAYSLEHALSAQEAEQRGAGAEAVRQWRIVFNNSFPARLS